MRKHGHRGMRRGTSRPWEVHIIGFGQANPPGTWLGKPAQEQLDYRTNLMNEELGVQKTGQRGLKER